MIFHETTIYQIKDIFKFIQVEGFKADLKILFTDNSSIRLIQYTIGLDEK